MNPAYIFTDSTFNKPYGTNVLYMGCRTKVQANRHGEEVCEGRGNLAFTTLNLPRIAMTRGDFWHNLESKLQLAEAQLMYRWNVQKQLYVKDIPFIFGQGIYMGSENLGPFDKIESAAKNGTLTIGFIGLAEALTALAGDHHGESNEAQTLGIEIVEFMRDFCDAASERNNMNFSLLQTPAEGLAGRFTKLDKEKFGVIPGITDKNYYTNSSHIPVSFDIPIFRKIELEAPYHKLTNAGHIGYVELPAPPVSNVEGMYQILLKARQEDMGYFGFNFPIDICSACGFRGIVESKCDRCGSSDIRKVRRVSGYFSTEERFNDGKLAELRDRKSHR